MRATALATLLALGLSACGSSSKEPAVQNGGLHGAAPGGTVEGQPFSGADGAALAVAPAFCSALGVNLTGLVVAFSSYSGFCAFKRGANACGDHPSSSELIVILARGGLSAPAPIGPGTYPIPGDPTSTVVGVDLRRLGATCGELTTYQSVTGSVVIEQTSPTVKGTLTATFWSLAGGAGTNLGSLAGPFEVGACTLPFDLCGIISNNTCPTPACIP